MHTISVMDNLLSALHKLSIRPYVPDALYLKSQALLAQGRREEAREILVEARTAAEALGSRRTLWEILLALSQIEKERGDPEEAEEMRRRARQIVEYIADHAGTSTLRASFLNLPRVRAVLEPDPRVPTEPLR